MSPDVTDRTPLDERDRLRPVVFALHGLGLTARVFDAVAAELEPDFRVVALDLPGFGSAVSEGAASVDEIAEAVLAAIARETAGRTAGPWILLGHSMGGKIASVVASRVLDGSARVFGLRGVVLLAPSPVTPEPMDEDRRAQMLSWLDGDRIALADAATFVDANVGAPWSTEQQDVAVGLVRQGAPEAWESWLVAGSREDWSDAVGELDLPALVLAGEDDEDLGADAQPLLVAPTYPRATVERLPAAGHLLPLERPAEVAAAVRRLWDEEGSRAPVVPAGTAAIIVSDHTGARVRAAFASRSLPDPRQALADGLGERRLATLRTLLSRVLPVDLDGLDLAARLDQRILEGVGDGWRHGDLPDDATAYRLALDELDDLPGSPAELDELLTRVQAGEHPTRPGGLTPEQLALWFTDLCADAATTWLQHPAALAQIDFDGFATGGDGPRKQGFVRLRLGTRESWEGAPPSRDAVIGGGQETSWT